MLFEPFLGGFEVRYSTQIPACLWFLARDKNPGNGWRDRRGEVLLIDARKLGHMAEAEKAVEAVA